MIKPFPWELILALLQNLPSLELTIVIEINITTHLNTEYNNTFEYRVPKNSKER